MGFTAAYTQEVVELLSLAGGGERLMPLVIGAPPVPEAVEQIRLARVPPAARAGLYCYFDFFDQAHEVAQELSSAEGSFWHGILHRREPDAGNAAYWFRRTGPHAVFPALARQARGIAPEQAFPIEWDSFAFIEFCERARNSPLERAAMEIQRVEWQLLFDYCMRPGG